MKFLNKLNDRVGATFTKTTWRRDREGQKDSGLKFEMTLTPEVMKALPRVLQDGIGVLQRDAVASMFDTDLELKGKTVSFAGAPGAKEDLRVDNVTLSGIYIEKLKKGTGTDILLHFSMSLPLTPKTVDWQRENFGNTVFILVTESQGELADAAD